MRNRRAILNSMVMFFLLSGMLGGCSGSDTHPVQLTPQKPTPPPVIGESEIGSQFRGYVTTNQMIAERFLIKGEAFELGAYLGEEFSEFGTNLMDLLGVYKSTGYGSEFRNGKPNSLNMLLWYLLLKEFSRKVSTLCEIPDAMAVNSDLRRALEPLCGWPLKENVSLVLANYWFMVMGFEAPLEEMAKWQEMAMLEDQQALSREAAIQKLTLSILYNPYFLLRH